MRAISYDIRVKHSLVKPGLRKKGETPSAYYKKAKPGKRSRNLYQVHIYLEGSDLAFVKQVTYTLHKSFRNPVQIISRSARNPNCLLTIWTWGFFTIRVDIEDFKDNHMYFDHYMDYSDQLKLSSTELNWHDVT